MYVCVCVRESVYKYVYVITRACVCVCINTCVCLCVCLVVLSSMHSGVFVFVKRMNFAPKQGIFQDVSNRFFIFFSHNATNEHSNAHVSTRQWCTQSIHFFCNKHKFSFTFNSQIPTKTHISSTHKHKYTHTYTCQGFRRDHTCPYLHKRW